MTTFSAKVICDSKSLKTGQRLVTVMARYPRFIHSELMTHRALSKNASSSRAIPINRLIKDILEDTAMPIHWGKAQKGMQAFEECDNTLHLNCNHPDPDFRMQETSREDAWLLARDNAIMIARHYGNAGYHKQIINRLLEPFVHMNTLISGTEWSNFFALRCHEDAQPEIQKLACAIRDVIDSSKPADVNDGEWHLPFISNEEREMYANDLLIKMSVARCARVSYLTTEGKPPTIEQDLQRYVSLVGAQPVHASPAEHVATPDRYNDIFGSSYKTWKSPELHGNFVGWIQHRKLISGNTQ